MLQDIGLTYQQFKNCRDNLSFWLEHLPRAQVRPGEGPSQIAYKLQAQKVRSWGCLGGHLGGARGPLVASVLRGLRAQTTDPWGDHQPPTPTLNAPPGKAVSIWSEVGSELYAPGGSNSYRVPFPILASPRLCTGHEPEAAGPTGWRAAQWAGEGQCTTGHEAAECSGGERARSRTRGGRTRGLEGKGLGLQEDDSEG